MLSYRELEQEVERLRRENASLKAELSELRSRYGVEDTPKEVSIETVHVEQSGGINKYSTPDEKIALFRSLFVGRTDVFAKRWYSKSSEKSGYQPVCGNEWEPGLCDKRKFKCAQCPNRKLMQLTDNDIYRHLSGKDEYGRDVVGIYPMLTDETCHFCCIDFDKEGYQESAKAYLSVCRQHNIPAYLERSRSGNGAHVWLFFESPIPAKNVRLFAGSLLTKAMENCTKISFKSYDRMLPNQDTMPNGGFGNLIALPLQGKARKQGNSVFVNEDFIAYDDQWAYLSQVQKISEAAVSEITSRLHASGGIGILVSDSDEKPWITPKREDVTHFDFPTSLTITRANMIYIPTQGISSKAQNRIKRLAAFKNPDFYRAQAMRKSTFKIPRIICNVEIFENYIGLPRGCENALRELLDNASINYFFDDQTNSGQTIDVAFNGKLREEQQPAADALLKYSNGVLSATTAFGKTVIAAYLISQRKVNTLILVHTQALMNQWKQSMERFLQFNIEQPELPKGRGRKKAWSPVGTLGAGSNSLRGTVDIAIMQSLFDGDEVKPLVRDYGMIIVDECHHVSAVNFENILRFANAKYVYGLTATPTRQDGHHPIIFMQCGEIHYRVDAKAQAEKRPFSHYMIPRFTSFRKNYSENAPITEIYKDLTESELRNRRIADDILQALNSGRTPIVLTERKDHIEKLREMLDGKCENIIILTGAMSAKEKRLTMETLAAIPDNESLVILATGKYVGEGFDYPRLDTLFLALPISWKGKLAQYAGRLHRNYAGKNEVLIYDYADIHIPVLEKMYQRRLKSYASIGYQTRPEPLPDVKSDVIYDGKSFYPVFQQDISNALREIIIVSPFMRKNRLSNLKPVFASALTNGLKITVVSRPPEDFSGANQQLTRQNAAFLSELGVTVRFKSGFHQKFTVIDTKTVWYGSVNFLSFGTAEESIMRLESSDIACALLDTVM